MMSHWQMLFVERRIQPLGLDFWILTLRRASKEIAASTGRSLDRSRNHVWADLFFQRGATAKNKRRSFK